MARPTACACPTPGSRSSTTCPPVTASQSAPVDGVIPVNACSVVVAVDGTASNSCEPTHVSTTTATGSVPVFAPVTVCAVSAALDGTADGTCTGTGSTSTSTGSPGSPGTGATVPVTLCGVQAALEGSADASCPQPVTSPSTASPTSGTGTRDARRRPPRPAGHRCRRPGRRSRARERADGGDGGVGHIVAGVDGRSAPARGRDRSGSLLMGLAISRSARRRTKGRRLAE